MEMYWSGISSAAIARHFGIPVGTMYSWVHDFGRQKERAKPTTQFKEKPIHIGSLKEWFRLAQSAEDWLEILQNDANQAEESIANASVTLVCGSLHGQSAGKCAAVVYEKLKEDPLSGKTYAFRNKCGNAITTLSWNEPIYHIARYIKTHGTFIWPEEKLGKSIEVTRSEFEHLISLMRAKATESEALKSAVDELQAKVNWLMEQFRLAMHRRFGASSEKSADGHTQLSLFNEAEVTSDVLVPEPELIEIEKHFRKRRNAVNDKLPADLPAETVVHELPPDEQVCPECSGTLHVMGTETLRRELKLIPAKAVIVEHVRKVYACRNCERDECGVPIVKAAVSNPVIKGGFASPEAVAHIASQKFVTGVPLYRQEQEWTRQGINLSRQTMSNWLIKSTFDWLEPVYDALKELLCMRNVLYADETTLQVLREPDKPPESNSYMWLYRTGGDALPPIVLYEYQPDRRAEHPKRLLKNFSGWLHADGYEGYHGLSDSIRVVGCFAHARRKFDEAVKGLSTKERSDSKAMVGKRYCDKLFSLERDFAEMNPEERFQKRQELSKPVLDEFYGWISTLNPPPKTGLASAVVYMRNQREFLERYLEDGRLEISNNRAERSIKPFVIGRKNWLFANTPRGAKAGAILYSIIETAKENDLNPYEYLSYIFRNAPNWDIRTNSDNLEQLLPWFVPDSLKAKQ
jgi:transposase